MREGEREETTYPIGWEMGDLDIIHLVVLVVVVVVVVVVVGRRKRRRRGML